MTVIIEKRDDVPEFSEVLSAPNGLLAFAFRSIPNYQAKVAVLALSEGGFAVVVEASVKEGDEYFAVTAVALSALSSNKMRMTRLMLAEPDVNDAEKFRDLHDLAGLSLRRAAPNIAKNCDQLCTQRIAGSLARWIEDSQMNRSDFRACQSC